jgi:uncharacterized protein
MEGFERMGTLLETPEQIRGLLHEVESIAVVGVSERPLRDSNLVARYLQQSGYRIVPVNPTLAEVLELRCYASLRELPAVPDLVDVFRRPDAVAAVVDEAVELGVQRIWLQRGVIDRAAIKRALTAGIDVVADRCIMEDHKALCG